MADISKVQLPTGTTYDIKDATARELIAALQGGAYFLGITTTALEDEATKQPIIIGGEKCYATNGNIAMYRPSGNGQAAKEFIFKQGANSPIPVNFHEGCVYFKREVTQSGNGYYYVEYAPQLPETWPTGDDVELISGLIPDGKTLSFITSVNGDDFGLYIKYETGVWYEFGDLSNIGDLAGHDYIDVALNAGNSAVAGKSVQVVTGISSASSTFNPVTKHLTATATGTAVGANGTATVIKSTANLTATTSVASKNISTVGTVRKVTTFEMSQQDPEMLVISQTLDAVVKETTSVGVGGVITVDVSAPSAGDVATVLTGVKVTTQPTITLADTATTGGVEIISGGTVSTTVTPTQNHITATATAMDNTPSGN